VSLKDLSSSIWIWYREEGGKNAKWAVRKVIEIPAEPADPENLPPLLKGFKAVPPLVTDINLSLDDRFLYVSCWGTGEFIQYDVSDPASPQKAGSIHLGGIVRRAADSDGVVADAAPRRVPRSQSWDGVALRGGVGNAGTKGERSRQIARSHRGRPRIGHRQRGADYRVPRHDCAARSHPLLRGRGPGGPWNLLPVATSAPAVGAHAGGFPRL